MTAQDRLLVLVGIALTLTIPIVLEQERNFSVGGGTVIKKEQADGTYRIHVRDARGGVPVITVSESEYNLCLVGSKHPRIGDE